MADLISLLLDAAGLVWRLCKVYVRWPAVLVLVGAAAWLAAVDRSAMSWFVAAAVLLVGAVVLESRRKARSA